MQIQLVPIETLVPYEKNNKIHTDKQIEHLANSIRDFGFNQPIVIDENNVILAGHGKLLAACKLALPVVPVVKKVGLSNEQKVAYRLADNKITDEAEWHTENIKFEVEFLRAQKFNFEPFGIDGFKIPEFEAPKEDEPPEPEKKWAAVITLSIPAEEVDHFEPELDRLMAKFNGIQKERKGK